MSKTFSMLAAVLAIAGASGFVMYRNGANCHRCEVSCTMPPVAVADTDSSSCCPAEPCCADKTTEVNAKASCCSEGAAKVAANASCCATPCAACAAAACEGCPLCPVCCSGATAAVAGPAAVIHTVAAKVKTTK